MSSTKIHKLLNTHDSNIITNFVQSFMKSTFYRQIEHQEFNVNYEKLIIMKNIIITESQL